VGRRAGWLSVLASALLTLFFRDPPRRTAPDPSIVYAAADGLVVIAASNRLDVLEEDPFDRVLGAEVEDPGGVRPPNEPRHARTILLPLARNAAASAR